MKKNIRYIALDIGNVCISLDYKSCASMLGYKDVQDFFDHKKIWEINDFFERGQIKEKEFLLLLKQKIPLSLSEKEIKEAWCRIIGKEIPGIAHMIQIARSKSIVPIFFSNTSPLHYSFIRQNLSFFPQVTNAVLSFEINSMKPESRIYDVFEERYGIPCLYIDDKQENIEAALERNWNCYQMGNLKEMKSILEEV